ncbi:hypothetical protein Tco_0155928 [Tanacetum coccineum]
MSWFSRFLWCGGPFNSGNCPSCSVVGAGNEFIHDPNPFPYDKTPDFSYQPPQHHVETYSCDLCGNDSHYGYDCAPQFSLLQQREHAANLSTRTPEPSRRFNSIYYDDDDDEESTIPLIEIISQLPQSIAITPILPTMKPEDSHITGNENHSTIPEKEPDKLIKASVKDLVLIPSESEDTSDNDKDIESKDSYVSKLDEPVLLVTPLSDANKDECFDPGGDIDEIDAFLDIDVSTDIEDGYC